MASGGNLAGQIDSYLKGYGSPMSGLGNVYVAAGKKYGVDPRLPAAISIVESSGGKHLFGSYNAWGWGPGISFSSWADGITKVTRGLKTGYLSQGRTTPAAIVSKWAPASDGNDEQHWSTVVGDAMRQMGAAPVTSAALVSTTSTTSAAPPATTVPDLSALDALVKRMQSAPPSNLGLQNAALTNLTRTAMSGRASGTSLLSGLSYGISQDQVYDQQRQQKASDLSKVLNVIREQLDSSPAQAEPPANDVTKPAASDSATPAPPPQDVSDWVKMASGADRAGVPTAQAVKDFVAKLAQAHGSPLTITTGSNHNQYVVNTHRQSQHWTGDAADILFGHGTGPDNIDPALTALGRQALIAAGMPWQEAAKQSGGAFNVNGFNILFNTSTGGNHYNHLHVGV